MESHVDCVEESATVTAIKDNRGIRWTDKEDQILIENRGKLSYALIARMIGGGCTKNAVVGRCHRLGLEALPKSDPAQTIRRSATSRRSAARRAAKRAATGLAPKPKPLPPPQIIDMEIPVEQRKQLMDLGPRDCRWPVGDVGEPGFFFCGGAILPDCSYCAAHQWRSHQHVSTAKPFVFRRAA